MVLFDSAITELSSLVASVTLERKLGCASLLLDLEEYSH